MNNKSNFFAEIVESFLTHYKAQCWQPRALPGFGSLVVIEQDDLVVYALVNQSFTCADDAVFAVRAYQKTEEELKRDQPHVFALLNTFFNAIIIAYGDPKDPKAILRYGAAPVPARLHAFVRSATDQEWALFAGTTNYLSVLFGQQQLAIDELLVAFIAGLKQHVGLSQDQLVELLHAYTLWSGNDYRRMRFFAQRLEQL